MSRTREASPREPFAYLKRRFHVLAVDDEPIALTVIKESLEDSWLFHVTCVASAEEALEELRKGGYHAVLSDLVGIDGPDGDMWCIIREYGKCLPVIGISGMANRDTTSEAMSRGAFWVFDKPVVFTCERFKNKLREAILDFLFVRKHVHPPSAAYMQAYGALEEGPESVEEWAGFLGVGRRELRRMLDACSFEPRHLLAAHGIVSRVFECADKDWPQCEECPDELRQDCQYKGEFYYSHRTVMDDLLSGWGKGGPRPPAG